jgi:hypothetical protein
MRELLVRQPGVVVLATVPSCVHNGWTFRGAAALRKWSWADRRRRVLVNPVDELGPAAAQRGGEARLVVITGSATASGTKVWTEYETALSRVLLESRAGPRADTRDSFVDQRTISRTVSTVGPGPDPVNRSYMLPE